ncbi:MAG: NAD(P)/FAD-dependent oxidoreductase [Bacteriovoracaceae bacterium]|jgi:thioredoxin reductase (NADPH)|nr:NAD(P)/FAD-dependent oxidoreductase [Bacteriovoracaceae bacterium]
MLDKIYPIAVIGGGAAGVMAVIRTVLNFDETIFFPGSPKHKKKSRAFWVAKVENIPGHLQYKKGIMEPNTENLKWLSQNHFKEKLHWMKSRGVSKLEKNGQGLFIIEDSKGDSYLAKDVILCTGVMDTQPIINESIDSILPYANVQIVDYCIRCDGHHVINQEVTIIGHGEDAIWISFILHERYSPKSMTILTNGEEINLSEKEKQLCHLYNIKIITQKIIGIKGNATKEKLESYILEDKTEFKTSFSFISLGMIVYNELAVGLGAEVDERGFVKTDSKGLTTVDNLYVAGDLRANTKKQIYTSWDTAVDSADTINSKARRERREELLKNNSRS